MADAFFPLDMSESFIKIVDAGKTGNYFDIKSFGFVPSMPHFYLIDTEKVMFDQATKINKLISDLKIKKKTVNLIIPDSVSYSQIIEMPRLNEKELLAAIKYQADQFIPMPLDEVTLDIDILAEDKSSHRVSVLIVAAPKLILSKVEKTIELSGLNCQSVENELSATLRFIVNLMPIDPQGKTYLIVNFSATSTNLYLFDQKKGVVLMTHSFKIGYELFIKDLKLNLNLDDKQIEQILQEIGFEKNASYNVEDLLYPIVSSLIKEIEKFISAYRDKFKFNVDQILLSNESARIKGLDKKIANTLSLPTSNLDFFSNIKNNQSLAALKPQIPLFVSTIGGNF